MRSEDREWTHSCRPATANKYTHCILNNSCDTDLGGVYPILHKVSNQSIDISLSDFFDQETRVPKGSILSVTLFVVKVKLTNLFVDDFGVSY